MYAVVERKSDYSGENRETGLLVAGEWSEQDPLTSPEIGQPYRLKEVDSERFLVRTSQVTEIISKSNHDVRFKTKNSEYRVFLNPNKPKTAYDLSDTPRKV